MCNNWCPPFVVNGDLREKARLRAGVAEGVLLRERGKRLKAGTNFTGIWVEGEGTVGCWAEGEGMADGGGICRERREELDLDLHREELDLDLHREELDLQRDEDEGGDAEQRT
ncbi:hypothetical protein OIU76_009655 [Salix suchowensis]|nr:hypothetical protein OIU76_009655 [Salix suchowensis]